MRSNVDVAAAERAVSDLLVAIGADPTSHELVDTPARVARTLTGMLTPPLPPAREPVEADAYDELVVVRDVAFWSICADHLMPFGGVVHVAYGPGPVAVGHGLVAHVVERCARRLQTPSRLTVAIATELERELAPAAVGVVVEATRPCPDPTGADVPTTGRTTTLRGALRTDPRARAEFVRLTSVARSLD